MKKILLGFLLFSMPFFLVAQHSHNGVVAQKVMQAKASKGDFAKHQIFSTATRAAADQYSNAVEEGVVFDFDAQAVSDLRRSNPEQMTLEIPFKTDGSTIELDLVKFDLHQPGFRIQTSAGKDVTNEVDLGSHYRGMIAGNPNSVVSISIFNNEVIGLISDEHTNYNLGRLQDSEKAHIIYDENELKDDKKSFCEMIDDGVDYHPSELENDDRSLPGECVGIYVEAGQSVYNAFGSNLTNTTNFLNGVFAESFVLYANDGITMAMSEMFIWTTPDPYTNNVSSQQLNAFQANTGAFNGDLGHLVEVQNIGGIAAGFSGLCNANTDNSLCFSGFSGTSFNNVPTYSFNVFIISHEMGHLMGSRHTHACVWNGNGTAIDGCSGFTEGACALPPAANPGTIMSYCPPNVSFTQGFHPQPTAVMINSVDNATCLSSCGLTNDDCADAIPVTCGSVTAGTTVGATTDATPFCGSSSTSPGVWYQFVGTGDMINADLCGATHDSKISVYDGTCAALNCIVGEDDDFGNCGSNDPFVDWLSVLGTTYFIHVHGFGGGEGDFDLTITCTPSAIPNDDCTGALPIACGGSVTGSTVGAGVDNLPFCGTSDGSGGGLWYTFVGNGECVELTTCNAFTNYDTKLRVFEGSCAAPICVAGDDDEPCGFSNLRSRVEFQSTLGTTYFVLVHGFGGAEGDFQLDLICTPVPPLMVMCPADQVLPCGSPIPPAATTEAQFLALGGTISGGSCDLNATYTVTSTSSPDGDACSGIEVKREYTITNDITGISTTCQQAIQIAGAAAPTIVCPADLVVACEDEINLDPNDAVVTTSCGLGFTVYIKQPLQVGAAGCNGTVYTYIYKVVDDCGRVAECEQQVLISNTPASISVPAGGIVNCFADIDISVNDATVNDACAEYQLYLDAPTINGPLGCPGTTYTYTFRLLDVCGNNIEEDVVFTNANTAPPTIQAPDDLVTMCLGGTNPDPDAAIVTAACDAGYDVTVTGPQIIGSMDCPGTRYRYTYTVTDECGRTASDIQDYLVQNGPPEFAGCEEDNWLQYNCEDYGGEGGVIAALEAYIASVKAYSSCGVSLNVFNNFNSNNIGTCYNGVPQSITFFATDNCGRTTTCTTYFVVTDTEAPDFVEEAQDHWEMCNYNSSDNFDDWVDNHGGAVAYDGCSNDNISWSTIPANPSFNCIGNSGTTSVTVTFVATDNCGNSASTTATFNTLQNPGLTEEDNGAQQSNNQSNLNLDQNGFQIAPTDKMTLYQNRPNPFKNETKISFNLPEATQATLTIYDMSGRVLKLVDGDYYQGLNEVLINRSELGATGIVYYTLRTSTETATKIMVLMD